MFCRGAGAEDVVGEEVRLYLHSSAATAAWPTGSIMRDWGHVFDSSNSESGAREHSDCSLGPGAGCSGLVSAWGTNSDVKGGYASILRYPSSRASCLHCSIWRPLKSIGLNMLATGTSRNCFGTTEVRDVNQSVVEGRVDVCDSPTLGRRRLLL